MRDATGVTRERVLQGPGRIHEVGEHDHRLGPVPVEAVDLDDALHARGAALGAKVDAGRAEVVALDREPPLLEELTERRHRLGERRRFRIDRRSDEHVDLVRTGRFGAKREVVDEVPDPRCPQLLERGHLAPGDSDHPYDHLDDDCVARGDVGSGEPARGEQPRLVVHQADRNTPQRKQLVVEAGHRCAQLGPARDGDRVPGQRQQQPEREQVGGGQQQVVHDLSLGDHVGEHGTAQQGRRPEQPLVVHQRYHLVQLVSLVEEILDVLDRLGTQAKALTHQPVGQLLDRPWMIGEQADHRGDEDGERGHRTRGHGPDRMSEPQSLPTGVGARARCRTSATRSRPRARRHPHDMSTARSPLRAASLVCRTRYASVRNRGGAGQQRGSPRSCRGSSARASPGFRSTAR